MRYLVLVGGLAACKPLPPAPVLPTHAGPDAPLEGTNTVMLVVGVAGAVLGGGGYGMAVRTEYQATEDTTLGLELTGGVAGMRDNDSNGDVFRSGLIGARAYGRTSFNTNAAFTYGAGLAVMGSGSLTAQLHGGLLVGYTNDYAIPTVQLSLALAAPIIEGRAFGDERPFLVNFGGPPLPPMDRAFDKPAWALPAARPLRPPRTELYVAADVGVIVPTGDVNTLSLDLGLAFAPRAKDILMSLTAADAYDSRTPNE